MHEVEQSCTITSAIVEFIGKKTGIWATQEGLNFNFENPIVKY